MSTIKKEVEYMNSSETRIALLEQTMMNISSSLCEIKNDIKSVKPSIDQKFNNLGQEIKEENGKVWRKLESLDQRINDNFKYLMGVMITLFSGLYATALGGMLLRLCKWI